MKMTPQEKQSRLDGDKFTILTYISRIDRNDWRHGDSKEDIQLFTDIPITRVTQALKSLRADGKVVLSKADYAWIYELSPDKPVKTRENIFQDHLSTGNEKVPYYIFNITSALDCESEKLGLCPVADICYAKKAEIQYPDVKPYRDRQTRIWDMFTIAEIVRYLDAIQGRARTMPKILRFSESGDFRDQADVLKMAEIARGLKSLGWKVYGYTARTDLDLLPLIDVCQVNLSNDHPEFQAQGANRFQAVDNPSGHNFVCRGDCRKCKICVNVRSKVIEVLKH